MGLILLLPIIVSGFTYCNKRYSQFIKLHRYQGQYLYLKSVKYGLFIVIMSACVMALVNHHFPTQSKSISAFFHHHTASVLPGHPESDIASEITPYLELTILSIALSYGFAFFLNLISLLLKSGFPRPFESIFEVGITEFTKGWYASFAYNWQTTKIMSSCEILSDSPLDKIFTDAYSLVEEILITTDSGKVYVGFIANLAEPNESKGIDQEIKILPTASGYRDPTTKKVIFNTYYPEEDTNSYVIIRQDLIISASPFSQETYDTVYKTESFYDDLSS